MAMITIRNLDDEIKNPAGNADFDGGRTDRFRMPRLQSRIFHSKSREFENTGLSRTRFTRYLSDIKIDTVESSGTSTLSQCSLRTQALRQARHRDEIKMLVPAKTMFSFLRG